MNVTKRSLLGLLTKAVNYTPSVKDFALRANINVFDA